MDLQSTVDSGLDQLGEDDHHAAAVVTWRYLRLALVLLAVGLGAAVVYERLKVNCWQTSISAYYYTPVQGIFVGALVAIGVCLICIRGASDGEDALLNLAGICAPFVALVPTEGTGSCGSVLTDNANRNFNIGNNVVAALIVAWLALVIVGLVSFVKGRKDAAQRPSLVNKVGYGVACAALLLGTYFFAQADRKEFIDYAHNVVSIALFVFIFLNVCLNGVQRYVVSKRSTPSPRRFNRYVALATAMLVDALFHFFVLRATRADWVLTIEASLIVLFVLFWSAQTGERWEDGVNPRPAVPVQTHPVPPAAAAVPVGPA